MMKRINFISKAVKTVAFISAGVICGSSCISCGNSQKKEGGLSGEISLSGAFALYPLAVKWAEDFQKLHPGVRIDVSAGGAGKGMTDALAGVVDFGMVSREVYPQEIEKGAIGFAVAKDAVIPVVNSDNPALKEILAHGITQELAVKIWIEGNIKTWGQVCGTNNTIPLHVYTRSDACGAAETWAMWFGKKQEDLGGTAVFGDPGVASAVQKDVYGIGMNNIGYVYDNDTRKPNAGIIPLPIDLNNDGVISNDENFYSVKDSLVKAIAEGKYPSPPARDLYLVSKGVPTDPVVIAFLKYVLTEGQKQNNVVGYIEMPENKIKKSLQLLEAGENEVEKN